MCHRRFNLGLVFGFGMPFSQLRWFLLPGLIFSLGAVIMRYDVHLAERWGLRQCRSCGRGSKPEALHCAHCSERLGGTFFRPHRTKMARRDGNLSRRKWYTGPAGAVTVALLLSSWGLAALSVVYLTVEDESVDLSVEDARALEGAAVSETGALYVYTVHITVRNSGGGTARAEEITLHLSWMEQLDREPPGDVRFPDALYSWSEQGGGDVGPLDIGAVEIIIEARGTVEKFRLELYHEEKEHDVMDVYVEG